YTLVLTTVAVGQADPAVSHVAEPVVGHGDALGIAADRAKTCLGSAQGGWASTPHSLAYSGVRSCATLSGMLKMERRSQRLGPGVQIAPTDRSRDLQHSCGACPAPARVALRRSSPASGGPAEWSRPARGAGVPNPGERSAGGWR